MATVLDQLRDAIEHADAKPGAIADRMGIARSQLSRMLNGERGLSLETAERVAEHLGYEIVLRRVRRPRKAK